MGEGEANCPRDRHTVVLERHDLRSRERMLRSVGGYTHEIKLPHLLPTSNENLFTRGQVCCRRLYQDEENQGNTQCVLLYKQKCLLFTKALSWDPTPLKITFFTVKF